MSRSITIDEVIKRMFNIASIPHGKSALDVLAENALKIEDEIDEHNAKIESEAMADAQRKNSNKAYIEVGGDPAVDLLNRRLKYAENRHRLAGIVQQELEWEIKNNLENSILNLHYDDSGLLDHHSAAEWVKNKYDVYRFDYEELKFISEAKPQGNYKANAISFANQGFSGIQAKRYLIIMAYLIEKLAQLDDKYRTANKVNRPD